MLSRHHFWWNFARGCHFYSTDLQLFSPALPSIHTDIMILAYAAPLPLSDIFPLELHADNILDSYAYEASSRWAVLVTKAPFVLFVSIKKCPTPQTINEKSLELWKSLCVPLKS